MYIICHPFYEMIPPCIYSECTKHVFFFFSIVDAVKSIAVFMLRTEPHNSPFSILTPGNCLLMFIHFSCLHLVCPPIYVSVCVVCSMSNCVGELFAECICHLCEWGECFLLESYCVSFELCWFFCWLIRVWSFV